MKIQGLLLSLLMGFVVGIIFSIGYDIGRYHEMPIPQNTKIAPLVVRMEVCANIVAPSNTKNSSIAYKNCIIGVDGAWTVIKDK
jgi:hypothetical protein